DWGGGGHRVGEKPKAVLFLERLVLGFGGPHGLVAVAGRQEPQLPAMDPAAVVDQIERGFDAELHLIAELLGRAGERCRDSKPNLIIGHPADSWGALGCTPNRCDS